MCTKQFKKLNHKDFQCLFLVYSVLCICFFFLNFTHAKKMSSRNYSNKRVSLTLYLSIFSKQNVRKYFCQLQYHTGKHTFYVELRLLITTLVYLPLIQNIIISRKKHAKKLANHKSRNFIHKIVITTTVFFCTYKIL